MASLEKVNIQISYYHILVFTRCYKMRLKSINPVYKPSGRTVCSLFTGGRIRV